MSGFTDFLSGLGSTIGNTFKKGLDPIKAQKLLRGETDDDILGLPDPSVSDLDISSKSSAGMFGGHAPGIVSPLPASLSPLGPNSVIQGIVSSATGHSPSTPTAQTPAGLVTTPKQAESDASLPGIPSLETALGFKKPSTLSQVLTSSASVLLPALANGIANQKSGGYGGFGGGLASGVAKSFPAELQNIQNSQTQRRKELSAATSDPGQVTAYNRARVRAETDPMFSSGQKNFNDLMNEELSKLRQQQAEADIAHKTYGTTGWGLVQRLEDEGRHTEAARLRQDLLQTNAHNDLATIIALQGGQGGGGTGGGGGGRQDPLDVFRRIQDARNQSKTQNEPVSQASLDKEYQDAVQRVLTHKKQPGDAELISSYEQRKAQAHSGRRGGGSFNPQLLE